jgi:hypothetical protein
MRAADKQLKEKSKEIQKAFDREVARLNSMEPVLSEEDALEMLRKGPLKEVFNQNAKAARAYLKKDETGKFISVKVEYKGL